MNQEEINAKARELVEKYMPFVNNYSTCSKPNEKLKVAFEQGQRIGRAKQCALIDIQNRIEFLSSISSKIEYYVDFEKLEKNLKSIKQAIENL